MTSFEALGLSAELRQTIEAIGYDAPTPIQQGGIPPILEGRDLLGLAQTGTGKTAAFGLPLIERLRKARGRPAEKTARALVLAPTRELANQISENLRKFAGQTRIRVVVVVGGASIRVQCERLERGVDILVATPGRLLDLVDRGAVRLETVGYLVLDEADQMLDIGFIHALRRIAKLLGPQRQTLLFSATMPKQIEELAASYLSDPVRVQVSPPGKAADKVRQSVHFVTSQAEKATLLARNLADRPEARSLVFTRTKRGADRLMKHLVADGHNAAAIHGNKSQGQRERAIEGLRSGRIQTLVATDVAARGIDIPGVTHVFNYDLPEVADAYVHRIGRTARAGADGEGVAFCGPEEVGLLRAIERLMKMKIAVASGEVPADIGRRGGRGGPPKPRTDHRPRPGGGGGPQRRASEPRGGDAGGPAKPRRRPRRRPSTASA